MMGVQMTIAPETYRRPAYNIRAVTSIVLLLWMMASHFRGLEFASLREGSFQEYSQTGVELLALNTSGTVLERSNMACAAICLGMHRQCFSYVYDTATRVCTPGAYVHLNPLVPQSPISGQLYTDSAIDVNLNYFNVYFRDDVIVYLHISTQTVDYEKATELCRDMGGHLLTTREPAKYALLVDLVDGVHEGVWIGLNDLAEEGVFRWVDDNSVLTTEIGDLIWGNNQPDNHDDDQHCCFWWNFYHDVADFHCDRSYNFACEYPVPYRY